MKKQSSYQKLKKRYDNEFKNYNKTIAKYNNLYKAIWKAKEAIGIDMGTSPFNELSGNEKKHYYHTVDSLKSIIENLPV